MLGRLLIADDISANRIVLKARMIEAGFTPVVVDNIETLTQSARSTAPDLIIMSDELGGTSGLEICKDLRARPGLANVPFLNLANDTGRGYRIDAIKAGFDAIMDRLPDPAFLRARIRSLLRRRVSERDLRDSVTPELAMGFAEAPAPMLTRPGQIALIAPSLAEGLAWRNGLKAQIRDRIAVLDPTQALADLDRLSPPDAIVVSATPKDPDSAIQLVSDLRCQSETQRSAVLMVQGAPDTARAITALDLGVSDVIGDGFDSTEMAHLLRRELARKARDDNRRTALQDGIRLAMTDPLTGLYNRRAAVGRLNQTMEHARDTDSQFAVMVLDLDRFKAINDDYGHAAGDHVLTELSQRMEACLRRGDFMARIGGEEFLAVIKGCDIASAQVAAERLRECVAEAPVQLPGTAVKIDVTVSIGLVIGGSGGASGSASELIDLADRGLYAAKADGRNQVIVYQSAA